MVATVKRNSERKRQLLDMKNWKRTWMVGQVELRYSPTRHSQENEESLKEIESKATHKQIFECKYDLSVHK